MRPAIAPPTPLLHRLSARVSPALAQATRLPRRLIQGLEAIVEECRQPHCHRPAHPGGYCVSCWHNLYGEPRWPPMSANRSKWTREAH